MTFYTGQKVVCVDASQPPRVLTPLGLKDGRVYTIRWVGAYRHYVDGDFLGIRLEEIDRGLDGGPDGYGADDMPYRASRFRPLVRDPIATLRNIAVDPSGFVPNAPEGPRRERVREDERA